MSLSIAAKPRSHEPSVFCLKERSFVLPYDYLCTLCSRKCVIYRIHRFFVILSSDCDYYIQLAGALVYHADIDVCLSKSLAEFSRGAGTERHTVSDCGNQGYARFDLDIVGLDDISDTFEDNVLFARQLVVRNHDAESAYTAGHMLEQDVVILEYGKHSATETELAVHQFFFDEDYAVTLLARYARDLTFSEFVLFHLGDDESAGCLRIERIADVYRDTASLDGEEEESVKCTASENNRRHLPACSLAI